MLVHVLLLCWGWFACGGRWWCGQLSAPHLSQASSCRAGHCPRPHGMEQAYHTACSSRLQHACALPVIAKPSRESVCLAFRVIQERVSFQQVAAPHRPFCSVPCECRRLPLPGEGLPCTSELASACCNASSGTVAAKLLRLGVLPLSAGPDRTGVLSLCGPTAAAVSKLPLTTPTAAQEGCCMVCGLRVFPVASRICLGGLAAWAACWVAARGCTPAPCA